jgi:hypothetical protein
MFDVRYNTYGWCHVLLVPLVLGPCNVETWPVLITGSVFCVQVKVNQWSNMTLFNRKVPLMTDCRAEAMPYGCLLLFDGRQMCLLMHLHDADVSLK